LSETCRCTLALTHESERVGNDEADERKGRLASASAGVRQTLANPGSGRIVNVGVHHDEGPARSQRRSEPVSQAATNCGVPYIRKVVRFSEAAADACWLLVRT
jgi:hypothetical protein